MIPWAEERRTQNIVYLDFSKAFSTAFHNIFIENLKKDGLGEQTSEVY